MRRSFSKSKVKKSQTILASNNQVLKGIVFLFFFCLTIVFIFGDHGILKLYKIKNERKAIQKKIEDLRAEKEDLKNQKSRIENDLNYIEKIAREKYKMVKPGEKIFKVIDKE